MMMKAGLTTLVVWCLAELIVVHSEMFTAVIDMKQMLSGERDVSRFIKFYVELQRKQLTSLSRYNLLAKPQHISFGTRIFASRFHRRIENQDIVEP